jgi:mRNA interferase MazF
MIFEGNDIVVVPFPFTDKSSSKRRPAVVLSNNDFLQSTDHVIAAMITSAKNSDWISDVKISNLKASGLSVPCVIRMKLFTLPKTLIIRKIGKLSSADAKLLRSRLASVLPI